MLTFGTTHLSVNAFHDALRAVKPGEAIVYATGDLAYSRSPKKDDAEELDLLGHHARAAYDRGEVCLTQRRLPNVRFSEGGGASFEYIATKR